MTQSNVQTTGLCSARVRNAEHALAAYRKIGDGWQTRINADLRKARKLKAIA
jgi:uncharacterized protein (DUF4415 family)